MSISTVNASISEISHQPWISCRPLDTTTRYHDSVIERCGTYAKMEAETGEAEQVWRLIDHLGGRAEHARLLDAREFGNYVLGDSDNFVISVLDLRHNSYNNHQLEVHARAREPRYSWTTYPPHIPILTPPPQTSQKSNAVLGKMRGVFGGLHLPSG